MLLRFQLVSLSLICMSNDSANWLAANTGSRWSDRTRKICSPAFLRVARSRPSPRRSIISRKPKSGRPSAMAQCSQRIARTRMPPSGKIPVSTAALRTTSTTLSISTRASRLAEYSIVKCGMSGSLLCGGVSGEVAAHRAIRTIVGLDRVAFAGLDRANERSRQHHLAGLKRKSVGRDLVGKPGHAGRGMIEHAGGKPGFLQLTVTIAQRADPAQIGLERAQRTAAEHNAGIGGVVGDGIEYLSGRLCHRIDSLDPCVQDFQRRHHEIGRIQHVEHRAVRPGQPRLHYERQFGFDPRTDEAVGWHEAAIGKEHVVEKNPGIRLIDTKRALHGLRCEADLVAFDDAALGDLDLDPRLLDGIGVLDSDARVIQR